MTWEPRNSCEHNEVDIFDKDGFVIATAYSYAGEFVTSPAANVAQISVAPEAIQVLLSAIDNGFDREEAIKVIARMEMIKLNQEAAWRSATQ